MRYREMISHWNDRNWLEKKEEALLAGKEPFSLEKEQVKFELAVSRGKASFFSMCVHAVKAIYLVTLMIVIHRSPFVPDTPKSRPTA